VKLSRKTRVFATFAFVIGIGILSGVVFHAVSKPSDGSAASDLSRADEMAFNNNWIGAAPLYHSAERKFLAKADVADALYAKASQIPAVMASRPLPDLISETNQLLTRPGGQDPRVRLRILVVKGMLELEYDAALAKDTWQRVEQSANALGEHRLASRASGEQGILAFLLGDVAEAERRVKRAYFAAKLMMDRPAEVRYASLIGRGIVEFGRYQESLRYLDHAIDLAESHPEIAKPMIAYEAKAEALIGLKKYNEALQLIDHFIQLSRPRNLRENMAEGLAVRASILEAEGKWEDAIRFYAEGIAYAQFVKHWHSLNDINASLAKAYEHVGRFEEAMQAIDAAITANRQTPAEIYFVPRNLAIKADIAAKAGKRADAETLYQRGSEVLEVLLRNVPTPAMERELQSEVADLYSGNFNLLAADGRLADAFQVIERAHGRIEAQSLWYDKLKPPQPETAEERTFNSLELKLLDTSDSKQREVVLQRIYDTEQKLPSYTPGPFREPVSADALQRQLSLDEVLLEYVLSEPSSSVLAITRDAIRRYLLPSRATIDQYGKEYLHSIGKKQSDLKAGQALYAALMPEAPEITAARTLIIVPDGVLNVLPFAALVDKQGSYAIVKKAVISVPSGTVLNLLRKRGEERNSIPYLGVAAWTQTADNRSWVVRAITGPQRSQLVPLPESKREIESAAQVLPQPDTLLLGTTATRTKFLSLPLAKYDVLHLSLHGYADMEFPDRSALVFAPAPESNDSGFLQAREIRQLHLNARLVTLSACKTAVGPVYGSGTASIVNAFIEAGAQSVVSTLWDVDDKAGRKLMESFYRHLAEGEGRAQALREAKLEFVKSNEPPYYWANFQIVGDATEPLYPNRKLSAANGRTNSDREVQ
jgi:CHAT domain-containing protein